MELETNVVIEVMGEGVADIRRGLHLVAMRPSASRARENRGPIRESGGNPKTVLAARLERGGGELSAAEKDKIAAAINDLDQLRARCPHRFRSRLLTK